MEIVIGTKVKHYPTGNVIKVLSKTKVFIQGTIIDPNYPDWYSYEKTKVRISECMEYIEPVKEKSAYEKMKERSLEMAKKLPETPKEIGQHILWLKMAVTDRIEIIEDIQDPEIQTFREKGENGKFGFTEQYVNLLMHYAYEAGAKTATDNLTRSFTEQTNQMKHAIDAIVTALDANDLLPDNEYSY
jgi:hypothetical protein